MSRVMLAGLLLLTGTLLSAEAEDAAVAKLAAHWRTVRVQVKPEAPTLSFNFDCDERKVYWTVTASNGSVDYRAYDVRFFSGNTIIKESIIILEKLKRGQAIEGSAFVNPLDVTRIEVRLRQ